MDPENVVPLTQPPVAAPAAPAPAAPAPASDPAAAELARLRARLAELETAEAERQRQAASKTEADLVAKGKAEEVRQYYQAEVEKREAALRELEARTRSSERSRAIAAALTGRPLSYPEAAADLAKLWADDFEVRDASDGSFAVVCKVSLRPADQVIAERLASPRYAAYLKAEARGGALAGGQPLPTQLPGQGQPLTFEQQVMANWQAAQQAQAEGPLWQRDWKQTVVRRN